jgi:hypothetical protein
VKKTKKKSFSTGFFIPKIIGLLLLQCLTGCIRLFLCAPPLKELFQKETKDQELPDNLSSALSEILRGARRLRLGRWLAAAASSGTCGALTWKSTLVSPVATFDL